MAESKTGVLMMKINININILELLVVKFAIYYLLPVQGGRKDLRIIMDNRTLKLQEKIRLHI